jgi:PAS domain S-box-containing protein
MQIERKRKTIEVDWISASDLAVHDLGRAASLVPVDLQANEGIPCSGNAFAYARLMLRSRVQCLRDVKPALIKRAVAPRKRIRQLNRRSKLVGRQGAVNMAVGALNKALWDALRESEQRFRDYSETASDWLWETGPDHRFTRISGHLNAVGVMPSSVIGMARWDYATDVKSEPEKWRLHRAALDAHRPFRDFVYSAVNRVGSAIYIRTGGKPFLDASGNFLGYRGTGTDTTATIRADQAEQALRKARTDGLHRP